MLCAVTVAAKGDTEPERNETRSKVDEDRKHEYPSFVILVDCSATNDRETNAAFIDWDAVTIYFIMAYKRFK